MSSIITGVICFAFGWYAARRRRSRNIDLLAQTIAFHLGQPTARTIMNGRVVVSLEGAQQ